MRVPPAPVIADFEHHQKPITLFNSVEKRDIIMAVFGNMQTTAATASVLEFGSSSGHILDSLPSKTKVGIEINPAMTAVSRDLFKDIRLHDRTTEANRSKFDYVYSTSVIEHVDCPICEVRHMRDVLAPTGSLLILVKNDGAQREQDKWKAGDGNMHIYTWNALLLGNLLVQAGGTMTSTSFWDHFLAHFLIPHNPTRAVYRLRVLLGAHADRGADWCLQSDVVTNSGLQG